MKKTLLLLLSLLGFTQVYADHLQGGDIRCYYNGTNYNIELALYGNCTGIALGSSQGVTVSSASLGVTYYKTLTSFSNETVNPVCPGMGVSTCQGPSATYPGWKIEKYTDTAMLPAATDWVISYASAARPLNIVNITYGAGIYLEAKLNNTSINSNAVWGSKVNYSVIENTATSIPMQVIDADGDSLDIRLIAPRESGPLTSVTYVPGYSVSNPFGGGTCSVNTANHTLDILATFSGIY